MTTHLELRRGWRWSTVGEACDLNPRRDKLNGLASETPVTFVPMPAVDADQGAITAPQLRDLKAVSKGYTAFSQGDVIMAKITPCMENGKAAVVGQLENGLGFGSTEFHVLRPNGLATAEYLYHFIRQRSFRALAESHMTGSVGQRRVPAEFLRDVPIPLPSIEEQRRIAAKLDDLLRRTRSARERLNRVPAILRRLRRGVHSAAVSGSLTRDWRLERDLPEWIETTIGATAECLDAKRKPISAELRAVRQGDVPYFGANGQVGWIDDHLFDEDLVLVVEDETFIGRVKPFSYVIRGKSWVNNHAHVLRPIGGMNADFLNLLLAYYDFVPLTSGTTGRRKLNQRALMQASVSIPTVEEQAEIWRRAHRLLRLADAADRRCVEPTTKIAVLQEAILARAFRGDL